MPYTLRQKWEGRIGYFTYADMLKFKGPPCSRMPLEDGAFSAQWKMKNTDFNDLSEPYIAVDRMVLTFDRQGILRNWDAYR